MSKSLLQGDPQQTKVTSKAAKLREVKKARDQLQEIRQERVPYKEYQARVHTGRAKREALLSETESCTSEIDNIETIATYVKRKIEFYSVACGALQQEIEDARSGHPEGKKDYLNEDWLEETNTDLLAGITTLTAITEVANQEKLEELQKRSLATVDYGQRKSIMEDRIGQLHVDARAVVQTINQVKRDRDDLRHFMHEHADRTFQTAGDHDSYTRRQENAQSLQALEHRISFVCDLNESKVREICSAYRCWLARIRKDNTVLYETLTAAWRWTPKNKLANRCRRVKHMLLHQGTIPAQTALLDEQIAAVEKMLTLCSLQKNNFALNVKLSYSELVAHFLLTTRTMLEDEGVGVTF